MTTSFTGRDQAQPGDTRAGLWQVMLAAVMWGTVGVTTKTLYGITTTNPLSIGFFRLALAAPVLLLAGWQAMGSGLFKATGRDFALMGLMGLMTALYQVCYFTAIELAGVAVAALITLCAAPVIVASLSAALAREALTPTVIVALICALTGTVLLIDIQPEKLGAANTALTGVLWALGSALNYAIVVLISRRLAANRHPLQPIAIGFSVGALVLLACTLPGGPVVSYPLAGWALLAYLGWVPTILAYTFFMAGMRHVPATVASIATLLEPLTASILAWLIFAEQFSPMGLLGGGLLCGAMLLLLRK